MTCFHVSLHVISQCNHILCFLDLVLIDLPFLFHCFSVNIRYGEQAAQVTNEGLGAAGHAIGTAWTVFKIGKALNPKSVIKPTKLAKAAAKANSAQLKAKK